MKDKKSSLILKHEAERITDIFLCIMFTVFPLVIADYGNITATKYVAFLAITGVFIAAFLFILGGKLLDGYRCKLNYDKHFLTRPDFYLILYILIALLSFALSPYKGIQNSSGQSAFFLGSGRYDGFLTHVLYIAVFLLLGSFGVFEKRHIALVTLATILMCIIAVIQLSGENVFNFYPQFDGKITKFISTIGNLDVFSGILCVFIPIIVASYVFLDNTKAMNAILLPAQLMSIYLVLELGVSSGKLALLITMLVLAPFAFKDGRKMLKLTDFFIVFSLAFTLYRMIEYSYDRKASVTNIVFVLDKFALIMLTICFVLLVLRLVLTRKYNIDSISDKAMRFITLSEIAIPVAFIVGVGFSLFSGEAGTLNSDILGGATLEKEIINFLMGNITDSSGSGRIGIWRNALEMGLKNPIFGTGIGSFLETFESHIAGTDFGRRLKPVDVAHNEYIHLFCTVGIAGLMSYLLFLVTLAVRGFRTINKNPYIVVLGSAVLCYCIQAFFSFSIVISAPYFWICAGLLYRKIKQADMNSENRK